MHGRPLLENVNVTELMLRVRPRCEDIFVSCFWKGNAMDCCTHFWLQRTEEGFCYSFNSRTAERLNHTHWSKSLQRNNAAGATTGLEIFFKGQAGQAIEDFDILRGINVRL
ncbi:hypothetical protein B566_EDAN013897 [Ephemera danica]|nr:hypothetical protein B566_EDAN013897 [Ephemera danica]